VRPIFNNNSEYYLGCDKSTQQKFLCIEGDRSGFEGEWIAGNFQCPLTPANAVSLRKRLPWLNPQPLGLNLSFGFGDRLGMATPGHIAANRDKNIAPIFAQQSVRENHRTNRTPQDVLDDAMWAVFASDWRKPWGADADHVKEINDLLPFIEANYSFYTIDPNHYVDNKSHTDPVPTLKKKIKELPWTKLEISVEELYKSYIDQSFQIEAHTLVFQEETLLRAAAKYGRAIVHVRTLSDYLLENVTQFDLEISFDETDNPTSVAEHYFIANELRRLGVPFVSLAPRFIGKFEKGVDYIGDLTEFDNEFRKHTAVMHAIGGYKISIHTGSDKFSIYPSIAEHARKLVHVKTAGTSYLEALRVVAVADPPFFRKILDLSRERFETDRSTYYLSGKLVNVSPASDLSENTLLGLFDHFDTRQVLHVTFGSILDQYEKQLKDLLAVNLNLYETFLYNHFIRHLNPLIQ
jgi:tagaturonate epimerase